MLPQHEPGAAQVQRPRLGRTLPGRFKFPDHWQEYHREGFSSRWWSDCFYVSTEQTPVCVERLNTADVSPAR